MSANEKDELLDVEEAAGESEEAEKPASKITKAKKPSRPKIKGLCIPLKSDGVALLKSPEGEKIGKVMRREEVELLDTEEVDGKTWHKVKANDGTGYVTNCNIVER
jgi:hypothetical protein